MAQKSRLKISVGIGESSPDVRAKRIRNFLLSGRRQIAATYTCRSPSMDLPPMGGPDDQRNQRIVLDFIPRTVVAGTEPAHAANSPISRRIQRRSGASTPSPIKWGISDQRENKRSILQDGSQMLASGKRRKIDSVAFSVTWISLAQPIL